MIGTYYFNKFGVDFRSIRYPGVISSEKYDFNGTTDYSTGKIFIFLLTSNFFLEIFFHALEKKYYKCWLGPKT
jgi:threonine 3-dehydrogenase